MAPVDYGHDGSQVVRHRLIAIRYAEFPRLRRMKPSIAIVSQIDVQFRQSCLSANAAKHAKHKLFGLACYFVGRPGQ